MIPGYRGADFPEDIQPRYQASFAAARCLFLEIVQTRLYHSLRRSLKDVRSIIDRSAELLSDLIELEAKRPLN